MAHNERIPLGLRVIATNLAVSIALLGSFALVSCGDLPGESASEPSEEDEDEASDDDDGEDPNANELTVSAFVHEAAAKNCAAFSRCLGAGTDAALSGQSCLDRRGLVLEDTLSDLEPLIEQGRVLYDADAARACLSTLEEASCDELGNAAELACPDALSGTVALGQACDRDIECEGDAYCALSSDCPGSCTARHGQGEDCAAEVECEASLACVGGRCLASARTQEACNADSPCNLAALCVGANVAQGIDGTCIALADSFAAQEGDSCSFTSASYCAPGLSCVVAAVGHTGGVVSYCERPSARDAACSFGFPTACPEGQYCDADPRAGSYDGTCRDLPGEGQACVTISGAPPCAAAFSCVEQAGQRLCTPIGRIGDACASDAECRSQHCAGGECSPGFGC